VAANPERLRFYVDESALGVGKTLAAAREDTIHVGHRLIPECPVGVDDPTWIAAVAARDLIVIGRDKHIRTRPAEVQHLLEAGLRSFYLGGRKDSTTWGWLTWLTRRWDDMEEIIETRGPGPWFYVVTEGKVDEIPLHHPAD
jgi:PIN like domain